MALKTDLEGATPRDLVTLICNSKLTCTLTVGHRQRSGWLEFVWGRLVKARTSTQTPLGECLLSAGVLQENDLEQVLRTMDSSKKKSSRPIGTVLVALGYVESRRVKRALQRQMEDAFYQILGWKHGNARLKLGDKTQASQLVHMSLDTDELLAKHAQRPEVEEEPLPEVEATIVDGLAEWGAPSHPLLGD